MTKEKGKLWRIMHPLIKPLKGVTLSVLIVYNRSSSYTVCLTLAFAQKLSGSRWREIQSFGRKWKEQRGMDILFSSFDVERTPKVPSSLPGTIFKLISPNSIQQCLWECFWCTYGGAAKETWRCLAFYGLFLSVENRGALRRDNEE